jgi:sulfopyruvate decarboxylase TPP-binding subunit
MRGLFPVMWVGFWINALSGIALLIADATTMIVSWRGLRQKSCGP